MDHRPANGWSQGAAGKTAPANHIYFMQTFWAWLSQFRLIETYYGLDPQEYNALFDEQLEQVLARTSDPAHRRALEGMKGIRWMSYIAASVRNAGFRDQREIQERAHDVAVKLLTGTLFTGFDEKVSGPFDRRFKNSVGNAVRNMAELVRNRKRLLPTVPIQDVEPASMPPEEDDCGEKVIRDFRRLVKRQLGQLGVAVLDVRLRGGETKSLVGRPDLGSPGKWGVKRTVQQVKELLGQYAASVGDPGFLRDIERAMEREQETVARRRTATARRQAVGA